MSLTFYYAPQSTATMTEIVLEELGVHVEKVKVDIRNGETKSPDYRKINPNGLVPCIVHDGVAIWESAAIAMYLGETFGVDKGLYPAPGPARGEAMKWIVWTNVRCGDAMYRRGRAGDWPGHARDDQAWQQASDDLGVLMGILEDALAHKQFLVADTYTIADMHVHSFTGWMRFSKFDFAPFPNILAWSERCATPGYQRAMGIMAKPSC